MKIQRRQLILASLVLALGAAVYLNWQFSDNGGIDAPDLFQTGRELGEAKYVNSANISDAAEGVVKTAANLSEEAKKYFAEAQNTRQKAREDAEEHLKSLINSETINDEIKSQISKQSEEMAKNIQQECNIENLIKAKGFGECMIFLQNGECSAIVSPGNLNESSAVIIRDIASGQSGVAYDKIKIIEAK